MPIVAVRRPEPAASHPVIVARTRTRRPAPPESGSPMPAVDPKPDYEVGYAKPPSHSRFKPGQSGNPRGRPKSAKGMKTIIREMLTEKVAVRTPKGVQRMTKMQALLAKTLELAFAGNLRAQQILIQHYQHSVVEAEMPTTSVAASTEPDDHDLAILEEMRALLRAEIGDAA